METIQGDTQPARIASRADLEQGIAALRLQDPALGPLVDSLPPIPLRLSPAGFAGLAEIVIGQLVSRASANAIFARLNDKVSPLTPEQFLHRAGLDAQIDIRSIDGAALIAGPLAGVGLSRAKAKTMAGIALSLVRGELHLAALAQKSPGEARDHLTALPGIGPWSADIYLLFCIGQRDVFPTGDVALYSALGDHLGLAGKCPPDKAARHAERWAPWRSVAARIFYTRYAQIQGRDVLPLSE